jgi:hypothetical protein
MRWSEFAMAADDVETIKSRLNVLQSRRARQQKRAAGAFLT